MSVSQDVFSLINTLPEAMLIVDRRKGKIAGANAAFLKLIGLVSDGFLGTRVFDLPFPSQIVKHELVRLFIKVSRIDGYDKPYSFTHVLPDATTISISASASRVVFSEQEYVIFKLKEDRSEEALLIRSDSWKSYLKLASDPYMEFRLTAPVSPIARDNRLEFLQALGESLRVKFANNAAVEFYCRNQGALEGKSFLSLFSKESDGVSFLDMLSVVGSMKIGVTVNTNSAFNIRVEMNCSAKFDHRGDIVTLYCNQRNLPSMGITGESRVEIGNRLEMDSILYQPFAGYAFLSPVHPLERPSIEELDSKLDEMLSQIVVNRANETIIDIYGSSTPEFTIKSMRELFPDIRVARQVLKELFVMRTSSCGKLKASGDEDEFERVSIFRAAFDTAGRLTCVTVFASRHSYGYRPRHIYGSDDDSPNP